MLVCQTREFLVDCPSEMFGTGLRSCRTDALLDAWLTHIRLLDEFLLKPTSTGGVAVATQWAPLWASGGFLGSDRQRVSAQLAHLGWSRQRWTPSLRPPWEGKIRTWTTDGCLEFVRFVEAVPAPLKSSLAVAEGRARDWLADPNPQLT